MIALPQFPQGCAGCGGACCKHVGPPLVSEGVGICPELTAEGLCGIQARGEVKPEICSAFEVGSDDCRFMRRMFGVE